METKGRINPHLHFLGDENTLIAIYLNGDDMPLIDAYQNLHGITLMQLQPTLKKLAMTAVKHRLTPDQLEALLSPCQRKK